MGKEECQDWRRKKSSVWARGLVEEKAVAVQVVRQASLNDRKLGSEYAMLDMMNFQISQSRTMEWVY